MALSHIVKIWRQYPKSGDTDYVDSSEYTCSNRVARCEHLLRHRLSRLEWSGPWPKATPTADLKGGTRSADPNPEIDFRTESTLTGVFALPYTGSRN